MILISRASQKSRFFHLSSFAGRLNFAQGEFGENGYIHVGGQPRGFRGRSFWYWGIFVSPGSVDLGLTGVSGTRAANGFLY